MSSSSLRLGFSLALGVALPATVAASGWSSAGRLITPRYSHTATLLQNGTVLVAGGWNNGPLAAAEIYDPLTRTWSPTGSMAVARAGHTATLLANGTVLVAGGDGAGGTLASSEVFDPATGSWRATTAGLLGPRSGHTATLLRDGSVLVAGGVPNEALPLTPLASAERYFPASGTWQATGATQFAYFQHTANLLADGRVVVAGGNTREIYDPSSEGWSGAAPFIVDDPQIVPFPISRAGHASTVLPDGRVLTVGGGIGRDPVAMSNEIYDPVLDQRTPVAALAKLADVTTTLLPDGRVLEAGGASTNFASGLNEPEGVSQVRVSIYDAAADTWTAAPDLGHQRTKHTATLLPDGHVLIVGGIDPHLTTVGPRHVLPGAPVADAEAYDPSGPGTVVPDTFSFPAPGQQLPPGSPATLLPDGTVLLPLAGQVYDPATGLRAAVTSPQFPHSGATATLLVSGRVLLVGGGQFGASGASAEIYDPVTQLWSPTGSLGTARSGHTATLLPDGRVLVAGGSGATSPLASAEVYDPASGLWTPTAALSTPRRAHTASLLPSGKVLVVGGAAQAAGSGNFLGTAEIYDPVTAAWAPTGGLSIPRASHTATVLPNGQVLVIGGTNQDNSLEGGIAGGELYDPASQAWRPTGSMAGPRANHTATLLLNGKVLVVGIFTNEDIPSNFVPSSLYDPDTGTFATAPAVCNRVGGAATLLPDGRVLISGGDSARPCLDQTYEPDSGAAARRPQVTATTGSLAFGSTFTVTGTRFRGDSEAGSGTTSSSATNYPLVQVRSVEGGQTAWIVPDARPNLGDEPMTLQFSRLPASLNPGFHLVTAFVDGMPSRPASASASAVVGLSCSIAITTPPAPQTVPLGTSATFDVVAQGARAYQWRRDGIAIPGAVAASYTTPPIQGADSGSLYDVVVSGPCASATSAPAALTVADSTPPVAAVVAPSGGEYFLLTPAAGPVSTEGIAWSMSDNVRVCQVRVSLLYSDDGGVSYLPAPAGGGLPQVFGPGGSCAFPGVGSTNLTYSVPTTYPSGRSGSLYRVQVEVFDQVGLRTAALSQNPFYIVQSNPDVRTLILSNTSRMRTVMGVTPEQASALDTRLQDLSVHSRVQGVVLDLGLVSALLPYYAALDAAVAANDGQSVGAANDLLFGPNGIHDQVLSRLRAFPGVRYLILVGDDRIIPLARMPDGTALFDETNYPAGGDLSGADTAVGQALAARRFLSDDPLALVSTARTADLSTSLFLPDLSVGRLVETPEEITTAIATFIGQDGVLDLGVLDPATGHKVLVTGYDFLQDSAALIRDRWKAVLGAAGTANASPSPVDGSLVGGTWGLGSVAERRAALLSRLCGQGGARYGIASLSGHASHSLEGLPADGGSFTDIQGLAAAGILDPNACGAGRGVDLAGGVVYAVGCHGGLPVPGSNPLDVNRSLDLPQTLLSRGVVAYVANSGYGWGPRFGPGYSKRLMELLTELMAVPGSVVTGDAVRQAKLRYFDQSGSPDAYDSKSLMQWTLYGLPMYAVKTGIPAAAASSSTLVATDAPARTRPSVERVGDVTVQRRDPALSAAAASLPASLTQLDLRFDFTAASVYQKRGASGALLTDPGCSDPDGCYYTLNGLASGRTDLPVQPYFVYDSRLSGTSQHGVLWKGGTYDQESGWKPVFTTLTSNGGDGSDHGVAPREIGIKPTASRRVPGSDPSVCAAGDQEVNSLAVTTGEVLTDRPADPPYSTERRFRDVNVEVLYFNSTVDPTQNCDRSGPVIGAGPFPAGLYHAVDGNLVEWSVPVSDPAGVWRAIVVVNDNSIDPQGRGRWTPVELSDDGSGTWRGSFTAAGSGVVTYMIQAVDNRGNVSWLDFQATTPVPVVGSSAPAAMAAGSGLPSSGVPLDIPLPVDVLVGGPTGPHVDAFSPTSGLFGASVSIFGRNFGGTTAVAFNGATAQFVSISATNLMAVVPAGATSGPISVTTPSGTATSATSFTVVPGLSVGDTTVTRPIAGSLDAVFTVDLAPPSPGVVTVQYRTVDGTAQAGTDYAATAGTLTFSPNASSRIIRVPILGNGPSGAPLTFSLEIFDPSSAGLVRSRGTGTILRPWRVSDWNGDGKADIFWQNLSTGEMAIWLLDGAKRIGVQSLDPDRATDRKQRVAGSGDFNADGQTDLVFQHQTTGAVTVWLMNRFTRASEVMLSPSRSSAWRLAAVADWNGDDGADLVWQNTETGAVDVWTLNGTRLAGTAAVSPSRPAYWQVVASVDWNGDRKPDLLWQNQKTGELEVWFMNGTTRTGRSTLSPSRPWGPFKLLSAVGDFNGDGKPDLLFRDPFRGRLSIWLMNGTSRTDTAAPSGVNYPGELPETPGRIRYDVKWQIVGPR